MLLWVEITLKNYSELTTRFLIGEYASKDKIMPESKKSLEDCDEFGT